MDAVKHSDSLRVFAEAYGIAVRAGVLTPNIDDEKAVRKLFGLPEVTKEVVADWAKTSGTRQPITLADEQAKREADAKATKAKGVSE